MSVVNPSLVALSELNDTVESVNVAAFRQTQMIIREGDAKASPTFHWTDKKRESPSLSMGFPSESATSKHQLTDLIVTFICLRRKVQL